MNKEKEVLLALLLEKYSTDKIIVPAVVLQKQRIKRRPTRYNIYRASVYQVPWSNQEHEAMVTFYNQGKSFSEIANLLGRSQGAVEIRCRQTIIRPMHLKNNA